MSLGRAQELLAVGVFAVVLSAASCGGDSAPDTTGAGAASADGASLYQSHCAQCHGADLRGTDRGPSHLSIVYEPNHHGDAAFLLAVRNGSPQHHWRFGDMPPVEGLSDDDVAAVTAYVRRVQEAEGFEPYPP